MSHDSRNKKAEQLVVDVVKRKSSRGASKEDKRHDLSNREFSGKKEDIPIASKSRGEEDDQGLDVLVTSEPLKDEDRRLSFPSIQEQNSLFNRQNLVVLNGREEKGGMGRKLTETRQDVERSEGVASRMEDEDKVDNKSHSSLNFNSIEGEKMGIEGDGDGSQEKPGVREETSSSRRKWTEMLGDEEARRIERRRTEERTKRLKEVSMEKGGIKSGRLKRLTHPLDRSVSYVFTVTIFFTFIALISGLPILITISSLLPLTWIISYIFSCELFYKTTSWNKVTSPSSPSSPYGSRSKGLIPLTPMESYWNNDDRLINNYRRGIASCLLYFDHALTLEQFKDVLVARVLSKESMSRFRATIVYKGVSRRAFWKVIPMENLPLNSLVIQEPKVIGSKSDLRSYVYQVLNEPLYSINNDTLRCPQWKIILVRTSFINQVVIIIRVHQSICDGIGLLSTLIEQLADQAPPSTTTFIRTCQGTMTATNSLFKPRFGGINFSVNVFRAILAGPLTVILWILWSFTRRKYNFLQSFPFYSSPDYNNSCGIKVTTPVHEHDGEEGGENRRMKRKRRMAGKGVDGRGKRRHHHNHQHRNNERNEEHSIRNREGNSCSEGNENYSHSRQQELEPQQLQQFDKRNMSSCCESEVGAGGTKGVLFTSSSTSAMADEGLKRESGTDETIPGILVPSESVTLVTSGQKSGGKQQQQPNLVLEAGSGAGKGGKGRKFLSRAFGSHSPLSSSCSRIKSATSERMRMSTGITSSSSISPSSSEKGRRPKGEIKLQIQPEEHLLEGGKSMTEVGGNMTTRMKGRMMSLIGVREGKKGSERMRKDEVDGKMEMKKKKNRRIEGRKNGESDITSRLPSLAMSNHSSSCNSRGSKSSSGRNNKCAPHHQHPTTSTSSANKFPLPPFNYSFSSSSQSTKLQGKEGVHSSGKSREETELDSLCDPIRSIHWSSVDLTKVYRVKQVTRSCLNDVVLTAIAGSIRDYLVKYAGVDRPPNLALSIPVDVRVINDSDSSCNKSGAGGVTADSDPNVSFVMLTSPLPTRTEGAIPRMWEVKQLTDEIKASPDAVVMYGTHYYFSNLLPSFVSRFLINLIHRNSSLSLSNLQGPPMNITVNSHQLHSVQYFMSVPPTIPVTFNVITYGHKLFVSVTSTSILIPSAKKLFNLFSDQIDLLADLLSKRRIPGESRSKKRPHHVIIEAPIGSRISGGLSPITAYSSAPFSTKQLLDRLHHVQYEVNRLNEALDEDCPDADAVNDRLCELKAEFSHLVKQIRRRKSIAEYGHNIVFSTELEDVDDDDDDDDDDMDGEMRPPTRRFSFVSGVSTANAARRSSIVSAISSFGGSSSSIISGRRSPGTMTASSSTSLEHPSHVSHAASSGCQSQSLASRYKRFSLTPSTTFGRAGSGMATGSRSVPTRYQSPSDPLSSSPSETTPPGSSYRSESIV